MPVIYSDTGFEYMHEAQDEDTVFVMDKFDGDIFIKLHHAGARIVGPPVVIKAAMTEGVSTISQYNSITQKTSNRKYT